LNNTDGKEATGFLDLQSDDAYERLTRLFRYGQVGRCVNGVTHEVNNCLGVMLAYAELLGLDESLSAESQRMVSELVGAVKKCNVLIGSVTRIVRKERPNAAVTPPLRIVNEVLQLRGHNVKMAHITIETSFDEAVPSLVVDTPKLVQALTCIVMNAEEALAGVHRPVIRVTVRDVGQAIEIAIWNSGPPVSEEDRARIFERFFTTKDSDHLGLGLAFAREIARMHDGELSYSPDGGFAFRLPKENHLSKGF